eukprot:TRINITY_DN9093_c0_g1_i1.p1 TRINITY_DN9093_c0_g1~~TRINITY_DN9093_c0_g1_i1.p1  ORF type:complete len:472 (-),score=82.38 TRINITY_DN9093_c0_g1_i1:142-1557(-)
MGIIYNIAFLILLVYIQTSESQRPTTPVTVTRTLNVAVRKLEPFAFTGLSGVLTGYDVDIVELLAIKNGWKLNYTLFDVSIEDFIKIVANTTTYDIGIGGITKTPERERVLEFSHSTYDGGISIVAKKKYQRNLSAIFTPQLIFLFSVVILLMFVVAHLFWYFERNKGTVPRRYVPGVWNSVWWAGVTIATVGYGDVTPQTKGGRTLALLWMFTGIILIGIASGIASSAIAIQASSTSSIQTVFDLSRNRVGTIGGTFPEDYLRSLPDTNIVPERFDSIPNLIDALLAGSIDAAVFDSEPLLYYVNIKQLQDELKFPPSILHLQKAFIWNNVLPSSLVEDIQFTLLGLFESDEIKVVRDRYLSFSSDSSGSSSFDSFDIAVISISVVLVFFYCCLWNMAAIVKWSLNKVGRGFEWPEWYQESEQRPTTTLPEINEKVLNLQAKLNALVNHYGLQIPSSSPDYMILDDAPLI